MRMICTAVATDVTTDLDPVDIGTPCIVCNVCNSEINLNPNENTAEATNNPQDFLSNGFKIRGTEGNTNTSGNTYIFMAFAEAPLVGSNNVPCTAR